MSKLLVCLALACLPAACAWIPASEADYYGHYSAAYYPPTPPPQIIREERATVRRVSYMDWQWCDIDIFFLQFSDGAYAYRTSARHNCSEIGAPRGRYTTTITPPYWWKGRGLPS